MPRSNKKQTLFSRDTILHLRIPFSFFLLPVFCFGISQAQHIYLTDTVIVFIALHLFIYPGSNSYNSYMDKDTGSIGGLEKPPPVTRNLYYASIICDTIGLALCAVAGWQNMAIMAVYVAFSKAYSWHGVRLKKYAYISWLVIAVMQGGYTFMLAKMAAEHETGLDWFTVKNVMAMVIASLLIGGSYPLTQIYQHKEDSGRGDYTISYRMGIKGTFMFTLVMFLAAAALLFYYFNTYASPFHFYIFSACLAPVMVYFLHWFFITNKNPADADYAHTMRMNKVSAICMVVCFAIILIVNHVPLK